MGKTLRAVEAVQTRAKPSRMQHMVRQYADRLSRAMTFDAMDEVPVLGTALRDAWRDGRTIFLCGNGGGVGVHNSRGGMHVEALSANPAVITCLANDLGFDRIYSEQLRVKAQPDDVLIVLSGSGNSPNVVKAIETGNQIGMKTFAILGFSGGRCKELAQHPIHFELDDMQIAEDLQLIIGHLCMRWLCANPIFGIPP